MVDTLPLVSLPIIGADVADRSLACRQSGGRAVLYLPALQSYALPNQECWRGGRGGREGGREVEEEEAKEGGRDGVLEE